MKFSLVIFFIIQGDSILGVICQATRDLPFGALTAAQWSTTRHVEAQICMYLADRQSNLIAPDQSEFS